MLDDPTFPRRTEAAEAEPTAAAAAPSDAVATTSPAVERFRSCRWRALAEDGSADHCTHRDVLPYAGMTGFNPEAWCPTCAYYKLRRTPKKRERTYDY